MKSAAVKKTTADYVTESMIAQLEKGVAPWVKEWKGQTAELGMPYNAYSKKAYRGANVMILWLTQSMKHYRSNGWMTKNQINELGGSIRKGEKATWVLFRKKMPPKPNAPADDKGMMVQRVYMVFNLDQLESVPESYYAVERATMPEGALEARFKALGIRVKPGEPAFHPELGYVTMPDAEKFGTIEEYRSTLAHEGIHWTGGKPRLNRPQAMDKKTYAVEELIAELGSAFVCASLGFDLSKLRHPEYLAGWIAVLKEDSKILLQVAGKAQIAADMILGKSFAEAEPEELAMAA